MCVGIKLHPECSLLMIIMTAYCSDIVYIPNVVYSGELILSGLVYVHGILSTLSRVCHGFESHPRQLVFLN